MKNKVRLKKSTQIIANVWNQSYFKFMRKIIDAGFMF